MHKSKIVNPNWFFFLLKFFIEASHNQKNNFPQILLIYKYLLLLKTYSSNEEHGPGERKHKWKPKKTSFGTLNKWYLVINTIHYNTMHGIHIVYVPGITKNSMVNIQQPSILLKVFFFRDSFCNIFEDLQNVYQRHLC